MICFIALIVFGVLAIFSASHRPLALEAFDCVFRRMTLRPCTSRLDERLKSKITGKLLKRSPKAAGIVYKNFEMISWAFTILMVFSIVMSGWGVYNYAVYGNCNGPQGGPCIINDVMGYESCESEHCEDEGCDCDVEGCDAPTYEACDGNCDCIKEVCEE